MPQVLALKGCTNIYSSSTSDKSVITVMACCAASGDYLEPMIVLAGIRFNYNSIAGFPEAAFGNSVSGWMDTELFLDWVRNVFIKQIHARSIQQPVILFVDGHTSHYNMEVSNLCLKSGVILYCLLCASAM